jgi:hypothetical protein
MPVTSISPVINTSRRIKNKIFMYKPTGYVVGFFSIVADTAGTFYMMANDVKWNKITVQKSTTYECVVSITYPSNLVSIGTITFATSGSDITIKTDVISTASGNISAIHSGSTPAAVITKVSDEQPTTLPPGVQRIHTRVQYPTPISSALTGHVFKLQMLDIDPVPRADITVRMINGKFEKNTSGNVWVPWTEIQIKSVAYDEIAVGDSVLITRDGPYIILARTYPIFGRMKIGRFVSV